MTVLRIVSVKPTVAEGQLSNQYIGYGLCLAGLALLASVVLLFGAIHEHSVLSSFVIAVVLLAGGLVLLTVEGHGLSMRASTQWFILAYSLRVCFAVLVHFAALTIDETPFLFQDEIGYYGYAERLFAAWGDGTISQQVPHWYERDCWAWIHIVGFVRFIGDILGGDGALNVKLVSCAAGALIVPYVYGIARLIFNARVARAAAGFAFLLPDYWVFSVTLLRDVFVSFAIVLVMYQILMLVYGRFRLWRLVVAVLLNFGLLLYLRAYAPFLVAGIAICCVLWDSLRRRPSHGFLPLLIAIVVVILLAFVAITLVVPPDSYQNPRNLLQAQAILTQGIDRYTNLAVERAAEDSLGVRFLQLPFCMRIPLSAARVVLLPIPPWGRFHVREHYSVTRAVLETLAGSVWYVLLPFLAVGVVGTLENRQAATVWIWGPSLAFILVLAVNTSLNVRHRLMCMPFLVIMVAQGWVLRGRYRQLVGFAVLLLLGLLMSYVLLKYLLPTLGAVWLLAMFVLGCLILLVNVWRQKMWGCNSGGLPGRRLTS